MFIRLVGILLLCSLVGCGSSSRAPVGEVDGASAVTVYVVERGDTLYSIAFRYGLDYRKVAEVNRIYDPFTIYPGQKVYLWQLNPSQSPAAAKSVAKATPAASSPGGSAATGSAAVVVTAVPGIAAVPVSKVGVPSASAKQGAATGKQPSAAPVVATAPPKTVARAPTPAPTPSAKPVRAPTPGAKVKSWRWPAGGKVSRRYSSSVHKGIDIRGNRGDPVYAVADGTVVYAGTGIVGFGELLIVKHNDIYISAYGHNDSLLVKEKDVVGAGQVIARKGSSGTDTVKLHFEIRKEGKPVDPLKLLPKR